MNLAFTLTMPRNNSANGRWSGEGRLYMKVLALGNAKKTVAKHSPIIGKSFSYDFGDGWVASVSVREVKATEIKKLRKSSAGFCGYDWMIDEILQHGRILTLRERQDKC